MAIPEQSVITIPKQPLIAIPEQPLVEKETLQLIKKEGLLIDLPLLTIGQEIGAGLSLTDKVFVIIEFLKNKK